MGRKRTLKSETHFGRPLFFPQQLTKGLLLPEKQHVNQLLE